MECATVNMPHVTEISTVFTTTHTANNRMRMENRRWYGVSLAIDGQIVYKHKGKRFVSDENHVVILPKGQSYELECVKTGSFTLINFQLEKDPGLDTFRVIEITKTDQFMALHKKMEELFLSYRGSKWAHLLSCFYEMVALLLDEQERNRVPFILKRALALIEERLSDATLSNTQLAASLHISEIYLRKLFCTYLSTSPKRYVQAIRINRARDLLIGSSYTVSEIAEKCGYSGVGLFCRAFKAKCGVTPSEYRKENKVCIL